MIAELKREEENDSYWMRRMKSTIKETPVMPEALKSYILEIKNDLKDVCNDEYCTVMCDGEIGVVIGRIEKLILANKEKEMAILNHRGDYTPNEIAKQGAKIIREIAMRVWNSAEITRYIEAFVKSVKSWKMQALAREKDCVSRRYHNQSLRIEGSIKQKNNELVEKVEKICQEVIDGIVQRYILVHQNPGDGENSHTDMGIDRE